MAVESVDRIGEGLDGIVVVRGAGPAAPPQRRQDPAGRRRPRRRRAAPDLLRRVQHGRGRPRAPRHAGHGDARRHGDRPPQAPGRVVERHVVLGARARPRRRPRRHPDPDVVGRRRPGASARRSPRRSASPPTSSTTSRSTPTGPTPCRSPGVARDLAARLGLPFAIPEPHGRAPSRATPRRACRSRSSIPTCAAASTPACIDGVHGRAVARLDRRPADRPRHAPDQQRGRRLELRDARAGPAQPHLRPGRAARRRPARPLGARRRDRSPPSTTSSAPSPVAATASSPTAPTWRSASPG